MSDITLTVEQVRDWTRPCVYIFRLGNVIQYVGESGQGVLRPFSPQHHIASLPEFRYDTLEILWQDTKEQAVQVQNDLIYQFSPQFNIQGVVPPLNRSGDACRPCICYEGFGAAAEFVVYGRRKSHKSKGQVVLRTKDRKQAKDRLRHIEEEEKFETTRLWKANAAEKAST